MRVYRRWGCLANDYLAAVSSAKRIDGEHGSYSRFGLQSARTAKEPTLGSILERLWIESGRRLLGRLAEGSLHNVRFADLTDLVGGFGFRLARVRGSHHIFRILRFLSC